MPRQPRPLVPGGIYHVTSRGNRRQEIFVDDLDRRRFLGLVANAARRYRWRCHAYCLMDNHFHLVVETPEPTISLGMYVINARHAQRFNRRHALDGHLFQDRFSSRLVETEWHLLELSRYVVLNPVRAGKCSAPGDWPWSSFRSTSGVDPVKRFLTVDTILAQFGRENARARAAYATFVHEGLAFRPH